MKYSEFLQKTSLTKEEVLGLAYGTALTDAPENVPSLPTPPMLMIDRVPYLSAQNKQMTAEKDVKVDDWFFHCHFLKDPVQPGCLGVDAIWQLLGLYCGAAGALGQGRALGCKEVEFFGQIRPLDQLIRYEIEVRRFQMNPETKMAIVIGTGKVFVDNEHIYTIRDAKVGTFLGIQYVSYPFRGENAKGGYLR